MKRTITILLVMTLIIPFFGFHSTPADALGDVWLKEYYKDKFGDLTEDFYLSNKNQFTGTYNTDVISEGDLGATILVDLENVCIVLYDSSGNIIKNNTDKVSEYIISVKDADGKEFSLSGLMNKEPLSYTDDPFSKNDRITIINKAYQEALIDALRKTTEDISLFIEMKGHGSFNYRFKAKGGNFGKLYEKEFVPLINEETYQNAIRLLNVGNYKAAQDAFLELGNYKDSKEKAEEAAMNLEKEEAVLGLKVADSHGFKANTGKLLSSLETLLSDEKQEFYVGDNVSFSRDPGSSIMLNIDYNPGKIQVAPVAHYYVDRYSDPPADDSDDFTFIMVSGVDQYKDLNMREAFKKVACALIFLTDENVTNYNEAARLYTNLADKPGYYITEGPLDYALNIEDIQAGIKAYLLFIRDGATYR